MRRMATRIDPVSDELALEMEPVWVAFGAFAWAAEIFDLQREEPAR